ncbi:hypothetical protein VCHA53O466_40076 [Vibrio chagasii]|nr:hypothetical protein VCHA53O466_40076 [Vibrio chagasii]
MADSKSIQDRLRESFDAHTDRDFSNLSKDKIVKEREDFITGIIDEGLLNEHTYNDEIIQKHGRVLHDGLFQLMTTRTGQESEKVANVLSAISNDANFLNAHPELVKSIDFSGMSVSSGVLSTAIVEGLMTDITKMVSLRKREDMMWRLKNDVGKSDQNGNFKTYALSRIDLLIQGGGNIDTRHLKALRNHISAISVVAPDGKDMSRRQQQEETNKRVMAALDGKGDRAASEKYKSEMIAKHTKSGKEEDFIRDIAVAATSFGMLDSEQAGLNQNDIAEFIGAVEDLGSLGFAAPQMSGLEPKLITHRSESGTYKVLKCVDDDANKIDGVKVNFRSQQFNASEAIKTQLSERNLMERRMIYERGGYRFSPQYSLAQKLKWKFAKVESPEQFNGSRFTPVDELDAPTTDLLNPRGDVMLSFANPSLMNFGKHSATFSDEAVRDKESFKLVAAKMVGAGVDPIYIHAAKKDTPLQRQQFIKENVYAFLDEGMDPDSIKLSRGMSKVDKINLQRAKEEYLLDNPSHRQNLENSKENDLEESLGQEITEAIDLAGDKPTESAHTPVAGDSVLERLDDQKKKEEMAANAHEPSDGSEAPKGDKKKVRLSRQS